MDYVGLFVFIGMLLFGAFLLFKGFPLLAFKCVVLSMFGVLFVSMSLTNCELGNTLNYYKGVAEADCRDGAPLKFFSAIGFSSWLK